MTDSLEKLIIDCGKYFVRLDRELEKYCAVGIFKLGKIDKKNGDYKGSSQELRFFDGDTPLIAIQNLYYELKGHYKNGLK